MNDDLIKAFTKVSSIININCCTGKNIESLNNLHTEINKTIESLKCCGNCNNSKDGGFITDQCFDCIKNVMYVAGQTENNWQPIN